MLTIPARIKKADINEACLTGGRTQLVTGPLVIGGVEHKANTLEFIGFRVGARGVNVSPGVWAGDFHFGPAAKVPPVEKITPAQLEAYQVKAAPVPAKPTATNRGNGRPPTKK